MSPWCYFMDCVVEAMYRSGMRLSTPRPISRMSSLSTPKALRAEAPPWRGPVEEWGYSCTVCGVGGCVEQV